MSCQNKFLIPSRFHFDLEKVVSKRVDKRATVRNRIKRKVLDIIGKKINKNEGLTLVFYMKNRAVESLNLEKEIETVMETIENRA
ncbi:MAG: hypothetical protein UT56_C0011G0011 [Candidatus Levybacteria bacterium GW2011_GWB1_39_7]|nr:MAG: hypothetical protein UT56_C0011G0011 [Candidatus Levybacteria bacterium GW2011_GWB1_39_7]